VHSEGHDHVHEHTHDHFHNHDHDHDHDHDHFHLIENQSVSEQSSGRVHHLEKDILAVNNLTAMKNRGYFEAKNTICFNLVSSPGSGKTTLLEETVKRLKENVSVCVIEGDQQSMIDADRIARLGVTALQINTGSGCHLDAQMISRSLKQLELTDNAVLFIENVGNLVCPALFDLGENARILVMSVTEGDDKPLKYPLMFRSSHICLINKIDLLPSVDFSIDKVRENARMMNPDIQFINISAKTGDGMDEWIGWISRYLKNL
jgi:hydrogenase nickel incorporation protein HypB